MRKTKIGEYSFVIGETKSVDDKVEITIKSNKILSRIEPSSTSGYYTYYNAGEGMKFLDIVMDVKNISSEAIQFGKISQAKISIDGKKFDVNYMCDEDNGARINGYGGLKTIDPLETVTFHLVAKIDKTLLEKDNTAELTLTINKKDYKYVVNIVTTDSQANSSEEQSSSTINLDDKGQEIVENQLVNIPNICEFTINSYKFVNRVDPSAPTGYYHYLNAADGKVYLDIKVTVKSLKNTEVTQDTMLGNITVKYNDTYEYKASKVVEKDNGGDLNTYTSLYNINPLETLDYHIIAELPSEVASSNESLYVQLSIDGKDYSFKVR